MVIQNKRQRPKPYIDMALGILFKQKMVSEFDLDILEIGSMRSELIHYVDNTEYECCNDGHSTYLLARTGWKVISVDIDPDHIKTSKNACRYFQNIDFFCEDAMLTPARISGTLGLLFLDAWDLDTPNSAENHLIFYQKIKERIENKPMILIDDTDLYYDMDKREYFFDDQYLSGKGKLIIPELLKNGYEIIFKGRQTLLREK